MISLTESQKSALSRLAKYGSHTWATRWHKSETRIPDATAHPYWTHEYYEYPEGVFAAMITNKRNSKGDYPAPDRIALKVAGELQNKELVRVHIDIRNHNLYLELTELGKITAVQLGGETPDNLDAVRWQFLARSPQTALMLGYEGDPNAKDVDWYGVSNELADKKIGDYEE